MSLLRTATGIAALVASLTLTPLASAETVVPPGNSAATQYTETFPTTGGNAEVNTGIKGGGGRSPAKVLGSHTSHKLDSYGNEGQTVAELATESAPQSSGEGSAGGESGATHKRTSGGHSGSAAAGGNGSGGPGGGSPRSGSHPRAAAAAGGSSGLGQVVSQATGSSSGDMGLLLPLVLVGALLWALVYAWRRRQPGQAAS